MYKVTQKFLMNVAIRTELASKRDTFMLCLRSSMLLMSKEVFMTAENARKYFLWLQR